MKVKNNKKIYQNYKFFIKVNSFTRAKKGSNLSLPNLQFGYRTFCKLNSLSFRL
jgi:hypothetical protein